MEELTSVRGEAEQNKRQLNIVIMENSNMSLEYRRVIGECNQLQERNRELELAISDQQQQSSEQQANVNHLLQEVSLLKESVGRLEKEKNELYVQIQVKNQKVRTLEDDLASTSQEARLKSVELQQLSAQKQDIELQLWTKKEEL